MSNSLVKRESNAITVPGVVVGAGGAVLASLFLPFWVLFLAMVAGVVYGVKKVL